MELIILGSGTAVPAEQATAGYLVIADVPIVMDIGRGTFSILPFLQTAIHESRDRKRKDLTIFGPAGTKKLFEIFLSLSGMADGTFKISVSDLSNETLAIGKTRITAKEVRHVDNLHCNGYRIEYGGKVIAYSGDSRLCDEAVELCRNADVAVLDCSVPKGFSKGHHLGKNHMGVTGCGEVAKRANVKKLVLSHMYPACDGHDLVKECREIFDGEVVIAKDLMRIKI